MGVLLGNFVQSFRQAAQMVTVCGEYLLTLAHKYEKLQNLQVHLF